MIRASIRLDRVQRLLLVALLLLLAGCSILSQNTVVFRENAEARVVTRVNRDLFLTNVRIGDREAGPFVIDSGADNIYLDAQFARELNLALWGEGSYGAMKIKWGRLASLEVGPLTLQNTDIGVADLSALSDALSERVAGILGRPFFAKAVVEVDYSRAAILCFDPKSYRLPRGEWQPLNIRHGRPVIAARLEGNIEGQFILDTASTVSVLFRTDFVQTHALLDNRKTSKHKLLRADGSYGTLAGKVDWFEVAGRRFENLTVQFEPPDIPGPRPSDLAGVIGRGLLRRFTVVFNYSELKIAFLPK